MAHMARILACKRLTSVPKMGATQLWRNLSMPLQADEVVSDICTIRVVCRRLMRRDMIVFYKALLYNEIMSSTPFLCRWIVVWKSAQAHVVKLVHVSTIHLCFFDRTPICICVLKPYAIQRTALYADVFWRDIVNYTILQLKWALLVGENNKLPTNYPLVDYWSYWFYP